MTKEKLTQKSKYTAVEITENQIVSFNQYDKIAHSFRVHDGGFVGIHYQEGKMSDEEGFKRAEKNLELKRPYPFELETGVRSRDKVETLLSDKELMDTAKKALKYLKKKYPDYTFSGGVCTNSWQAKMENSKGMDYETKDGHNTASFSFKHKDSKDISDGYFSYNVRTFKIRKFYEFVDLRMENFTKMVEMPEECIIMDQYYGYTGKLKEALDVEGLKLGTSLLTGKIGKKIFADDFSVMHNTTDKDSWMSAFWDGDGVVNKGDKIFFIKEGKVLRGYADKKIGKKYHVKTTGSAWESFSDIPTNGNCNMNLKISRKSAKELLNGRLAIIPIQANGGGFKEKGEYTMPVQIGLLTDGERILGRVPPFTISTNMFDMFGKDYIGVAKLNKLFNDKCILFKVEAGKL